MKLDGRLRRILVKAIGTLKGTPRQKEVAVAYVETGSEKAAAARLGMKPSTAKIHMQKLYRSNGMDWIGHVILCGCVNLLPDDWIDMPDERSESASPTGP